MNCKNPYIVDKESNQLAPCGQCQYCRIQRAAQWSVRLIHECYFSATSSFITLTYDEENVPLLEHESLFYPTLEPAHLTNLIKQIRNHSKNKIKYYACGEYGGRTGRPHYHAIIFNYPPAVSAPGSKSLQDLWPYGQTHIGTVTYESCNYVAGYIQKKWYGDEKLSDYYPSRPPFSRQSQGLGLKYAVKNEKQLLFNAGTTINGKPTTLPRYYRKKLIGDNQQKRSEYVDKITNKSTDNTKLHVGRLTEMEKVQQYKYNPLTQRVDGKYTEDEIAEKSRRRSRRQFNENLESKYKVSGGDNL